MQNIPHVASFRVANMSISEININDTSVYLISNNSLNSIYMALQQSTTELTELIENYRDYDMMLFLIFLLIASGATVISMSVLIPVVNKARNCKETVYSLLTELSIEEIKSYQRKCEIFKKNQMQKEEHIVEEKIDLEESVMELAPSAEKEKGEIKGKKDLADEMSPTNRLSLKPSTRISEYDRKYKKIASDWVSFGLKMIFIACIIEAYYLMTYLFANTFLKEVSSLVSELNLVLSRAPTHSLLLLMEKEVLFYNGSSKIEFQDAETYISNYHTKMYEKEESLLDIFANNKDYHTSNYNTIFSNIIFSNLCSLGLKDSDGITVNQTECESFNNGILKQGLYSSVIKYWDYLRQLNSDFFSSARSQESIRYFLNEERLGIAEKMQNYYFRIGLSRLENQLENDINEFFDSENLKILILFIVFLVCEFLLYTIGWRIFLRKMIEAQWRTKSLLAIIPPEKLINNLSMHQYIMENSSTSFIRPDQSQFHIHSCIS